MHPGKDFDRWINADTSQDLLPSKPLGIEALLKLVFGCVILLGLKHKCLRRRISLLVRGHGPGHESCNLGNAPLQTVV
jgi:hypothetical protein